MKTVLVSIFAVSALIACVSTPPDDRIARQPYPLAAKARYAIPAEARSTAYVGSEACAECHAGEHRAWKASWHANMHREVDARIVVANFDGVEISYSNVEIQAPDKTRVRIAPTLKLQRAGDRFMMTLVDRDNAANNQTWPIAYVFGGNWNQHFEARVGDGLYPTPMRWIVADRAWTARPFNALWWVADGTADGRPRRADEMPKSRTGDATCDGCHTTGYTVAKDELSGRYVGRRVELGIGCESCHGPGARHRETGRAAQIVNPARLDAAQQDQLCGQCHSRVTNKHNKDLSFPVGFRPGDTDLAERVDFWTFKTNPGNFWSNGHARKNRQQLHDAEFSKHRAAGITCITCHDTHSARLGHAQLRGDKNSGCVACHAASAEVYKESPMGKAGVGCTDCHMAKIANRSDPTSQRAQYWDASAHTMAVIQPAMADAAKMRSSCDSCHSDAARGALAQHFAAQQAAVRSGIADVQAAIATAERSGRNSAAARALLTQITSDPGVGAHHAAAALARLEEARKALAQ